MALLEDLTGLLNRYSVENGSDTPDFILAQYLVQCLAAFEVTTKMREQWYGRGEQSVEPPLFHSKADCNCWPCRRRRGAKEPV